MSERKRRPNRRQLQVYEFEHGGIHYVAHVGEDEFFLRGGKVGSAIETAARDLAITASLALQYGTPIAALKHALTKSEDGRGAGPLGKLLDLIEAGDG